nr:MAG TPA: hypothetical protein [Caudoviricetes sp.]
MPAFFVPSLATAGNCLHDNFVLHIPLNSKRQLPCRA